jgi:hypothetical protein
MVQFTSTETEQLLEVLPQEGDSFIRVFEGGLVYSNHKRIIIMNIPNIKEGDTVSMVSKFGMFNELKQIILYHKSGTFIELYEKDIEHMIHQITLGQKLKKISNTIK